MAVNVLLHALIALLVWLLFYALLYGMPKATTLLVPAVLLCFFPVLLGTGWLLSSLGVLVRDISQLTALLSHALLFLTPIFYSIDAVPALLQPVLHANPLTFVVEQLRVVLFFGQMPAVKGLAVYFVLASTFAWISLLLFRRLRPDFADMV
jgi:lipopolysaccharide transport system permease protein